MSTVIKAGQAATLLHRVSRVDLADHLREAQAIIADARRHADQLRAKSREEACRALEEAKQSGFEEGRAKGLDEGLDQGRRQAFDEATARFTREHAELVADFSRAVAEIDRMKQDLRVAAERDVLEFAVGLAVKLTCTIGELNREAAAANLARALDLVDDKSDLTIRVNPADLETMRTFAAEALSKIESSKAFELVGDAELATGGCIVEGRKTQVDASLETQTRQIVALLLGREAEHG